MKFEILLSGYHSILPLSSTLASFLPSTFLCAPLYAPPLPTEFLVILTVKQLQAKKTAKSLLPLNCIHQV